MRHNKVFSHDINKKDENESFAELMLRDADIVKPILKERLLKDYILGVGDSDELFRLYCDAFGADSSIPVRVALFNNGCGFSQERKLKIINDAERLFAEKGVILTTILLAGIILIVRDMPDDEIRARLSGIDHGNKSEAKLLSVYSGTVPIADIPEAFRRLRRCVEYSFYSDKSGVMCENEIRTGLGSASITPKYAGIEKAVSGGDERKTKAMLTAFYGELERCIPPPAVAKTYCLELYVCIIRCCEAKHIDTYMKGIVSILKGESISEIKDFINAKALEIVQRNSPGDSLMYSSLVKDTLRIIDENIGNEELSLRWIAKNHLFTNVDYLGKIFKKEVGKNFSHFVMEKRMERAKALILGGKKDRIYEVAEKVGYGSNSQYFSQVFKKYTGLSPLEYKESARLKALN